MIRQHQRVLPVTLVAVLAGLGGAVPATTAVASPTPVGAVSFASQMASHPPLIAADRAAAARRRAAQAAATAKQVGGAWLRTGKPARLIVLRPRVIDVVTAGQLTSRIPRPQGPVRLPTLAADVPAAWLSTSGTTALLSAALELTDGTTLDPGVASLHLTGGADPASTALIWVGGGTLTLRGVAVTSWNPATQQPLPALVPGRPYIVVGSHGHLNATDVTFSDLGQPSSGPGGSDRTGLVFAPGSSGSLVGVKLVRNQVGLRLSGSVEVSLDGVTIEQSQSDGLVLHNDHKTTFHAVEATNNTRNGVEVTGTITDRNLTGLGASGNGAFGVTVIGQRLLGLTGIFTSNNGLGGLGLTGCHECTVADANISGEPIGLLVDGRSDRITLKHPQVQGGVRGVVVTSGSTNIYIDDLVVDHSSFVGVSVGATWAQLWNVRVSGASTAVKITGAASEVTVDSPTIVGADNGIVVARGASAITLRNPVIEDVRRAAVVTSSVDMVISGGRIRGGKTGVNARAATSVDRMSISAVYEGIHVAPGVTVHGSRLEVSALSSGIKVEGRGHFVLSNSRVQARDALRGEVALEGHNSILPRLNWLAPIGVLVIAIAVLLEIVHLLRQRRSRPRVREDVQIAGAADARAEMNTG